MTDSENYCNKIGIPRAELSYHSIKAVSKIILTQPHYAISDLFEGRATDKLKGLAKKSGIYVFWWLGSLDKFKTAKYYIKGSTNADSHREIEVTFIPNWLDAATHNGKLCLYVGKSTNIHNRVKGHLRYNTPNIWKDGKEKEWEVAKNFSEEKFNKVQFGFGKKPNTVSQLRIGLERIFHKHALDEIKKHVALSWYELPDTESDSHAVNRFYIEDKLIGELFPLLNIDVER